MSVIRYRELSLSQLIEQSNLVVQVTFRNAFKEEVPVSSKDLLLAGKEFPPFLKKGSVFSVEEVLKNSGKINVPNEIRVPDENWRRFLGQHKTQHLDAPSKSYIVPEYVSSVKSAAKASILFLNHFQDMYEFTARNGFENKSELEKVRMLIAAEA